MNYKRYFIALASLLTLQFAAVSCKKKDNDSENQANQTLVGIRINSISISNVADGNSNGVWDDPTVTDSLDENYPFPDMSFFLMIPDDTLFYRSPVHTNVPPNMETPEYFNNIDVDLTTLDSTHTIDFREVDTAPLSFSYLNMGSPISFVPRDLAQSSSPATFTCQMGSNQAPVQVFFEKIMQ